MQSSTLYIIGNGFDCFHNLPTTFFDFGKYIKYHNKEFYLLLFDWFPTYYNQMVESFSLWENFEKGLKEIDQDLLWQYINNNLTPLGSDNWGDEDNHRVQFMTQTLLDSLSNKLKEYLSNWICSVDIKAATKRLDLDEKAIYLTFNYTRTLEDYYKISSEQILHIHGITDNPNSIIFGHNLDVLPVVENDFDDIRLFECERIIQNNYFKKTLKPIENIITTNNEFFSSLQKISTIIIIGHSINDIDFPYFKRIWTIIDNNTIWKISFKDLEDKEEHLEEKIDILVNLGVNRKHIASFLMDDITI
ncbi:hypothetical protein C7Y71_007345 [Pseudoprevotella muciniphila]|uniref:Bacteriophage abortive infection AbiH n=1 Tax=Pseudoprevotella muciniphila TaxID=2133944 RepID=A0A5P8E720_9BACT|nr:bacteriophage abortive infection AbiH family protein [Pseudoprevotella muciniphila]QFQ12849.1 hypothetical protein C7Y71_007345 [Pseudoprevotella muciniphila]